MGLFRKKPTASSPTEKQIAEREKTIREISKEIEAKNYQKATEAAIKLIEDCKEKDPFGEAFGNYVVAHSMILQYTDNISPSNYNIATTYLQKSIEIYQLLEKSREHRIEASLKGARVLVTLASLFQFVGKYNEAIEACQKSLKIFRRYGDKRGIASANTIFFTSQGMGLNEKINEALTFMDKRRSALFVRCPKDGKRCPLLKEDGEGRRNCPLYKCPLVT